MGGGGEPGRKGVGGGRREGGKCDSQGGGKPGEIEKNSATFCYISQ